MAVYSLPLEPRDRVLIGRAEYGANAISLLQLKQRTGCQLVLIEDDEHGQIDLEALERALAEDETAFVSLVHVPTQSGLVNPAVEVGSAVPRGRRAVRARRAASRPASCRSTSPSSGAGSSPGNGRKFLRGPRGTGFLYVHPELIPRIEPVMLDLHAASWIAPDTLRDAP